MGSENQKFGKMVSSGEQHGPYKFMVQHTTSASTLSSPEWPQTQVYRFADVTTAAQKQLLAQTRSGKLNYIRKPCRSISKYLRTDLLNTTQATSDGK